MRRVKTNEEHNKEEVWRWMELGTRPGVTYEIWRHYRSYRRYRSWLGVTTVTAVGGLGTSLGHGEVWIGVPVQCYMECNYYHFEELYTLKYVEITLMVDHIATMLNCENDHCCQEESPWHSYHMCTHPLTPMKSVMHQQKYLSIASYCKGL